MMDDKLYLVTCEGYTDSYGSYIYVVGIFTTEEYAKEAVKETDAYMWDRIMSEVSKHEGDEYFAYSIPQQGRSFCTITKVSKNTKYSLKSKPYGEFYNEFKLGGYAE